MPNNGVLSIRRLLRLTIYSEEVICGADKSVSTNGSLSGRSVSGSHMKPVTGVVGKNSQLPRKSSYSREIV